jgi:transcriptional regulator with XRE-family HTH domain
MDEQESVGLGELISFCRWLKGLSRARLGRKTGIDKSQIARYEADAETPRPATLQRIFQETGVSPRVHDFIRWCLRLIRQAVRAEEQAQGPPRQSEIREETQAAVAGTVERVLALARAGARPPAQRPGPEPAQPTHRGRRPPRRAPLGAPGELPGREAAAPDRRSAGLPGLAPLPAHLRRERTDGGGRSAPGVEAGGAGPLHRAPRLRHRRLALPPPGLVHWLPRLLPAGLPGAAGRRGDVLPRLAPLAVRQG